MRKNDAFDVELTADLIVRAYKAGIFPMAEDRSSEEIFWVSPNQRGILPLEGFKTSRSLRKAMRRQSWSIEVDRDFAGVIEGCATAGTDRDSTWINSEIERLYGELFERGICHTVEVRDGDRLVGGLYGLAIGGAFFGESMFHRQTDASKAALADLVARLCAGGFSLLDTQFLTPHLASMGGIEIPRDKYELLLAEALLGTADFYAIDRRTAGIPPV